MSRLPLALVAAVARNGGIGVGGALPWHLPDDLKRFKALTMGHALIMGRKTHEAIGRPLPGRRNLVISGTLREAPGCEVVTSLEAAIDAARTTDALPMVIGGGEVYRRALPLATHLYLTRVDRDVEADTYFPAIEPAEWDVIREESLSEGVSFVEMRRR